MKLIKIETTLYTHADDRETALSELVSSTNEKKTEEEQSKEAKEAK